MLTRMAAGVAPETRGIIGIVLATLLFTIMDVIAKELMTRNDPVMVIWARFAGQMVLVLAILGPRLRTHVRTARPRLQMARSTLHLVANALFFIAIASMPLAEVVAVFEIAPLLITVFAFLILHEPVGPRRWAGVVAGLVGALIIIRPGLDVFQPMAILPLGSAICMALFQIIVRMIGTRDSIQTSMFYAGLVGTVVMSAVVPFYWTTPSIADAVILLTFGWIGFVGHVCLLYALGQADASTLAPYNYANFLWALLLGFVVFTEVPDAITLMGAALILAAGLYVWHRERVHARRSRGLGAPGATG